jgi:hypothetical protein
LKHFWPIPLFIGAVGCLLGWWFHAPHFYYAWFGAYLFVLTLALPTARWNLRAIGGFTLLTTPLIIGWLTKKFFVPPDPLMLIYLVVGGFLAVAGLARNRNRVAALTFVWTLLAIVIGFVDRAWPGTVGQWAILAVVVIALRLAGPVIPRNWRILFPITHWLDMYVRVMPLKHGPRIPSGNLWIDASAVLLISAASFLFSDLQKLRKSRIK